MAESVAARLRAARGDLTVTDVSRRSGIPEARIRTYEEGTRHPYGKTLRRLAEAYGLPIADLVTTTPPTVTAPARQRRRRRRLAEPSSHHVIEVPVDVREDAPVRLTIELVLRPRVASPTNGHDTQSNDNGSLQVEVEEGNSLAGFRQAYDAFLKGRRA